MVNYISRFCREGLVQATRYAGAWYVNENSLQTYLAEQERQREAYRWRLSADAKQEAERAKFSAAQMLAPYQPQQKKRRVAELLVATLTLFAVMGSAALAFNNIAPEKFARAVDQARDVPKNFSMQLAAATSLPWLDEFASNIYQTLCPYISNCKDAQEFAQPAPRPTQLPIASQEKIATTTPATAPRRVVTPTTVINQPVIERVRETVRTVVEPGVNASYVDERLSVLENSLLQKISGVSSNASNSITQVYTSVAQMGRIEHLDDLDLTDPTITGGTISGTSIEGAGITGTISATIASLLATITNLTTTTLTATNATLTNATTTNATSTNFATTNFTVSATSSTSGLKISSLDCSSLGNGGTLTTDASGNVVCAADDGGSGTSFGQAWEVSGNFLAPTTTSYITNIRQASSTLLSANWAKFGATASSTFGTDGALTLGGALTLSGTINGPLHANGGVLSATTSIGILYGGTGATTASGARTNLGLGTIATQDANNVSISGGSITGITDLAVADGGTGLSSYTSGSVLYASAASTLAGTTTANLKATLALNNVENTALSTWAGSTNLTTLGTLTGLTVSGNTSLSNATTSLLFVNSSLSASSAAFGATATSSFSTAGALTLASALNLSSGGTGTTTAPVGQLLYGGSSAYQSVATSSASCSSGISCTGFTVVGSVSPSITFSAPAGSALSIPFASTTMLTATTASTTNFTLSSSPNAILLTNAAGVAGSYAGSTCTNQFVRSLTGAGVATCATVSLTADVTGTLGVGNGGTGWAAIQSGSIPYGNGSSAFSTTTAGTAGNILALLNGVPTWAATTTLSTISGTLAVSSGGTGQTTLTGIVKASGSSPFTAITTSAGIAAELSDETGSGALVFGTSPSLASPTFTGLLSFTQASSTQQSILDALYIGRTATTTIRGDGVASTLPYASSTALSVSGTAYFPGSGIWNSSGNVGIGTTTPDAALHVYSGGLHLTNWSNPGANLSAGGLEMGYTGGASALQSYNRTTTAYAPLRNLASYFTVEPNGSEMMRVNATGVGIGTSTPTKTLSVTGTALFSLTGDRIAGGVGSVDLSWSSPFHRLAFGTDGTAWGFSIAKNQAGTYTDLLTIMTSGNVGIASTSPSGKLTVVSDAMTTAYTANGTKYKGIVLDTGYAAANGAYGHLGLTIFGDADDYSFVHGIHNDGSGTELALGTNSTERMRIDSSGNVGIGTTAPKSNLDIVGTLRPISGTQQAPSGGKGLEIFYDSASDHSLLQSYDRDGSAWKNLGLYGLAVTTNNMSDARLKTNVQDLPESDGLAAITQLRPITYNWLDVGANAQNGQQIGFLAQDVEKIFPKLVSQNGTSTAVLPDGSRVVVSDTKSINYNGLMVPAVKAIQDLNLKLEDLATTTPEIAEGGFTPRFFSSLFARLTTWLADATNGIERIVARVFKGERAELEELCLGATCVDEKQLQTILSASAATDAPRTENPGAASGSSAREAIPDTDSTSTTTSSGVEPAHDAAPGEGGPPGASTRLPASGDQNADEVPVTTAPVAESSNPATPISEPAPAAETVMPKPANDSEPIGEQSPAVNE